MSQLDNPPTGGGNPGGSSSQIQFNDGGNFGGDSGLVYDKTTKTITLGVEGASGDIKSPSGVSTDTAGGVLNISSGLGNGNADGGALNLRAGVSGTAGGNGGSFYIYAGDTGNTNGSGGGVNFTAGIGDGSGQTGGDIFLSPGGGNNGALVGHAKIQDPASGVSAVIDTSVLLTSDKTYTLPDASGTVALKTGASGSFTTADAKTVTVVNGLITNIA